MAQQYEEQYQDDGNYYEEDGYYDQEEYEGWLWDDAKQQWVEDPNWVDPNAAQYNDEQQYTATATATNTVAANTGVARRASNTVPSSATATATTATTTASHAHQTRSAGATRPAQLNTTASATSSGGGAASNRPTSSSRSTGMMRPGDVQRERQLLSARNQNSSPKIDETNIPRVQISNKVIQYESKPMLDKLPPGSRTSYIAQDCGNATPRHVRMTLYNIPLSAESADKCSLAIASVIQPIANIGIEEEEVPMVDMGSEGPIRCIGCRAYMNPHALWIKDGTQWICNLCQLTNECPQWYRKNLDGQYQRRDKMQRAELHRGSVDYVAPSDLAKQMQLEPAFFFVIDVSCVAYQRDLIKLTVNAINNSLLELRDQYKSEAEGDDEKQAADFNVNNKCILRVGFLTYDSKIHFHALSNGAMHVISEVKDPFVSLPDSEILIPLSDDEKFAEWQRLLLRVPKLFEENALIPESENKSCFGSALYAASQVLQTCGGKIIAQQTSLPNIGIGALKFRDSVEVYGTDKERELYVSADPFYPKLTTDCASNFISIDIFCCASTGYCDLASTGEMSRKTGGQLYYYANFNRSRDAESFENDLRTNLVRRTVFRSVMAVRASKGLEVVDYFGNFFLTDNQEIQLPIVTSDTTLAVSFRHYERLNSSSSGDENLPTHIASIKNKYASIQVAMLYLNMRGQVYIRVHTVALPIVKRIADVFRCVDMDTVLNVSLKQCAQELVSPVSSTMTISAARKSLVAACVDILFVYRRYCAPNNAQRQLVLPEALKLLPLFTLGLLKNPLLADGVQIDERAYHISYALHMPCYQSLTYIHPYLYPMHRLSENECVVSETGRVLLPKAITLKYDNLKFHGLYVLDTGRKLYVVIGPDLPAPLFKQCFVETKSSKHGLKIDFKEDYQEEIDDLGYRLSLILDELRYDRPYWLDTEILLLPNTKDHDAILTMDQHEFLKHLIEDSSRIQTQHRSSSRQNPAIMSYVDFLVYIHKEIQKKFVDL
eukprot:CAMPEP_0197040406 /NCGR_PEP_ID=MMETSP1384-20130603/17107_1 /TAXON_ID=29189 /ORGANISM="Ammonia sp." /LENGTH=1002 /DNA_ID=CAMNT_0042471155 /DNA_START=42 /DNA_END=3050 /DNA_ORIENTATION=-